MTDGEILVRESTVDAKGNTIEMTIVDLTPDELVALWRKLEPQERIQLRHMLDMRTRGFAWEQVGSKFEWRMNVEETVATWTLHSVSAASLLDRKRPADAS